MAKDKDILKLIKLLKFRGHNELAAHFAYSVSNLIMSSTYGSRLHSIISSFEILSPIEKYVKLRDLSQKDKKLIFDCIREIYPTRDGEPEITNVEYIPDLELSCGEELVDPKNLRNIDFSFIHEQIEKCKAKISDSDYDGAVTNSRALIESLCLYILEKKGVDFVNNGDLVYLFKNVRKCLGMNPEDHDDPHLKQILSGSISIINGIAGTRNTRSDAHGTSPSKHYKLSERHAVLCVNLSKSISEYLFSSFINSNK